MSAAKKAKCPVCNWDIEGAGVKAVVERASVVVCCDECRDKVLAAPAKYLAKK